MKYVLFYLSFLLCAVTAKANNGEHLWLDCHWSANPCQVVGPLKASPTIGIAAEELRQHWTLGPQVRLSLRSMLQLGEGYHINRLFKVPTAQGHDSCIIGSRTTIWSLPTTPTSKHRRIRQPPYLCP